MGWRLEFQISLVAPGPNSTRSPMARCVSLCGAGELCGQSSSFFAIVPDFSMRTRLAYAWKEKAQAPLIAPLEGAQRVSTWAALGHPWHRYTCESARVAVRCGRVERLKSYFLPLCLIFPCAPA